MVMMTKNLVLTLVLMLIIDCYLVCDCGCNWGHATYYMKEGIMGGVITVRMYLSVGVTVCLVGECTQESSWGSSASCSNCLSVDIA